MSTSLEKIRWEYTSEEWRSKQSYFDDIQIKGVSVKSTTHHRVWRLPDSIFIKEFFYNGFRSIVKSFKGGHGCKEGKIALELTRRGISTFHILAFGAEYSKGLIKREVLITKEVIGGKSFAEYIIEDFFKLPFHSKDSFVKSFAQFIKQMHDMGVFHDDLHLNNIFVQTVSSKIRFVLVDLGGIRILSKSLSWNMRASNLGVLLAALWFRSTRSLRFRFLKYYGLQCGRKNEKDKIRAILRKALKHFHRLRKRRFRSSRSTNSSFIRERAGPYKIYRTRHADVDRILHKLLYDPDRFLGNQNNQKNNINIQHCIAKLDNQQFFLKRYNNKNGKAWPISLCHRLTPLRTWSLGWQYPFYAMIIPRQLICLIGIGFRHKRCSYILSEYKIGASSLSKIWNKLDSLEKKKLCAKLGIVIGSMHQFGGYHGNLNWENILIQPHQSDSRILLWNLEQGNLYKRIPTEKALSDVSQILKDMKRWDEEKNVKLFMNCWQKWSGFKGIHNNV